VVDFSDQCFRLIRKQCEAHVLSVYDVHLFVDDQINPPRQGQKPVVCIIHFGNFAFFVNQQRHAGKTVLGDKVAVRLGRIPRQAENFNLTRFVLCNVLLKLNKLANSLLCVVFGVKGKHHGAMILENVAEFPQFAVLIGQCEIISGLTGYGSCVLYVCSGTGRQNEKNERNENKVCLSHPFLLIMKSLCGGRQGHFARR